MPTKRPGKSARRKNTKRPARVARAIRGHAHAGVVSVPPDFLERLTAPAARAIRIPFIGRPSIVGHAYQPSEEEKRAAGTVGVSANLHLDYNRQPHEWRHGPKAPPAGPPVTVAAGAATLLVTAAQGALIARQNRLRSALWGVPGIGDIAARYSCASARAWNRPAMGGLSGRLAGLAGEARALAVALENIPGSCGCYDEARSLAHDLAVEAGNIVHQEETSAAGGV